MIDPVYCTKCRKPIETEDKFCRACGEDQRPPGERAAEMPPPKPSFFSRLKPTRWVSNWTLFFAFAILGISLWSQWTVYQVLGGGLWRYDFSTAKQGLISHYQIEAQKDLRAEVELYQLHSQTLAQERVKTLQINKEVSRNGAKILFVTYEQEGIKHFAVQAMTKDARTGYWYPYDQAVEEATRQDNQFAALVTTYLQGGQIK